MVNCGTEKARHLRESVVRSKPVPTSPGVPHRQSPVWFCVRTIGPRQRKRAAGRIREVGGGDIAARQWHRADVKN